MAVDTVATDPAASQETLLGLYRQLLLIRRFEERTAELFAAGDIKGTAHSCVGQEAVAVGLGSALRPDDYLAGHHRSHGHVIAKGGDVNKMMAELMGKRTGYCRGLGGSMHIADLSLNILGCNGVVGAGLPLACGAALRALNKGEDRVAVAVFGDGAAGEGVTHEAMNLAAVWKLPVLFLCENNQFALTTSWRDSRPLESVAARAAAYDMPSEVVDGNDVFAVRDAVARFAEAARSGHGPAFIEALTYRQMQHSLRANLPTQDDGSREAWAARDPLTRFETLLSESGVEIEALERLREDVEAEVEAAVVFARESEDARAEDLLPSVYAPFKAAEAEPVPGERRLYMSAAVSEALHQAMAADDDVVVIGEDVRMGGIFRATEGLHDAFGDARVRDTPISELGFVGLAVGAALTGLRPVVEIQIFDFVTLAMDALVNQAAKMRFMFGGTPTVPLVVRGPGGGGVRLAAQHSQSLEAWFAHVPGLVVLAPSNAYDAKGLLLAAIRDDNPVVFIESKSLLFDKAAVPEAPYYLQIGKANTVRTGTDVTLIATQAMVKQAVTAAKQLERVGVSAEVIDPRSLYPLDTDTLVASAKKTGRVVIIHEAVTFMGIGAEMAALIGEQAFGELEKPVKRLGAPHHPMPYQSDLERASIPGWRDIVAAAKELL